MKKPAALIQKSWIPIWDLYLSRDISGYEFGVGAWIGISKSRDFGTGIGRSLYCYRYSDRYVWENYHFIKFSKFQLSDSPPTFDQKKIIDLLQLWSPQLISSLSLKDTNLGVFVIKCGRRPQIFSIFSTNPPLFINLTPR